jgi:IS4 transposase
LRRLLLDHQGCLPCWALITEGRKQDIHGARSLNFLPGAIVAMDRGYNDYRLFATWTEAAVFFVTRMKDNAPYEVVETREGKGAHLLRDEVIRLTGSGAADTCSHLLRRGVVWDEERQREIVLLANLMTFAARTIAGISKERWQIERFFKALKQNLKVKTFVGTSENAVQTQIWTALIAMLLLKFLQLKSSWKGSLSNRAAMPRFNLLTSRDLWAWLNDPFGVPIHEPTTEQLARAL